MNGRQSRLTTANYRRFVRVRFAPHLPACVPRLLLYLLLYQSWRVDGSLHGLSLLLRYRGDSARVSEDMASGGNPDASWMLDHQIHWMHAMKCEI
jgi:hypothetical protein